jgi:hypothetical protein
MQTIRTQLLSADPVLRGLRVLLIATGDPRPAQRVAEAVQSMGGEVELATELFTGLDAVIDDPSGYGLFVLVCDETDDGLRTGARAMALLRGAGCRVPAIVMGAGCKTPTFPEDRAGAVTLPVNSLEKGLRPAIRHALRDRILWRAA